ncbi:hypothetical protein QBC35DRAFT_388146 [Podospora australis]|uniref:SWIM-type domain-containing protein n=1 Tax=Podospora australis TaxID=1536484 RepID=A0AAN6WT95_9PEZI|nr:hypothetical protein QBC35DRAFT_388146 [Podospora australis]
MPLSTPRAVLTALFNRITTTPLLDEDETKQDHKPRYTDSKANNNPLRRVPISHRHLIITLHVLFPEIVLPALDLLDRRLVTRLILDNSHVKTEERKEDGIAGKKENEEKSETYLVTSAAPPPSRRKKHPTSGGNAAEDEGLGVASGQRRYIVHLQAWNCTCAAFAFSSVQDVQVGLDSLEIVDLDSLGIPEANEGVAAGEANEVWSFGGMSLDGTSQTEGGGVPICKHLMACLLAARWTAALGGYVTEKRIGVEEMAGIVADV